MIDVAGVFVDHIHDCDIDGAYSVVDNQLLFICPCGCKQLISIPVAEEKEDNKWKIIIGDDFNKISIEPSIKRLDGCKFHGHLTNGHWRSNLE